MEPFALDGVYDQEAHQETVFNDLGQTVVDRALAGFSSTVFNYGLTGAGKTFTSLGHDIKNIGDGQFIKSKHGLGPRIANSIVNEIGKGGNSDIGLVMCFTEIFQDKIRDLGAAYAEKFLKQALVQIEDVVDAREEDYKTDNKHASHTRASKTELAYEVCDLGIVEDVKGFVHVKNAKLIPIFKTVDALNVLKEGLTLREQFETMQNNISSRAQTILSLIVVQRGRNNVIRKGIINLVDLAGCEKFEDKMGVSFQEAISIQNTLNASIQITGFLANGLFDHISYTDSKLTELLCNSLNKDSFVAFIANIDPNPSLAKENLRCLQVFNHIQNADEIVGGKRESGASGVGGAGQPQVLVDKRTRKLQEEANDYRRRIEQIQEEQKQKLTTLAGLLGMDDPDALINITSEKDLRGLQNQREAKQKVDMLITRNQELERKIEETKDKIEDVRVDEAQEREKQYNLINYLKSQVDLLTKEVEESQNRQRASSDDQLHNRAEELQRMLWHSQVLLEQKSKAIHEIPESLDKHIDTATKISEYKELGKRDIENEIQKEIRYAKEVHAHKLQNMKEQFEYFDKQKSVELDKFNKEYNDYVTSKEEEITRHKAELNALYQLYIKQRSLVENIETGAFNGGIISVYIPGKDKPPPVNRTNYKYLFHDLEKSKKLTSSRLPSRSDAVRKAAYTDGFKDTTMSFQTTSIESAIHTQTAKFINMLDPTKQQMSATAGQRMGGGTFDDTELSVDLGVKVDELTSLQLKGYVHEARRELRRQLGRNEDLGKISRVREEAELKSMAAERDHYKRLYQEAIRRESENKIAMDSQSRLLEGTFQKSIRHQQKVNSLPKIDQKTRVGTAGGATRKKKNEKRGVTLESLLNNNYGI